jgi:hypothetical protein
VAQTIPGGNEKILSFVFLCQPLFDFIAFLAVFLHGELKNTIKIVQK